MKLFAIILNVIWLGVVVWAFTSESGKPQPTDILIFVLVVLTLIFNVVAFLVGSGLESWISLFFQRKTLEEKKKIEALNSKDDNRRTT